MKKLYFAKLRYLKLFKSFKMLLFLSSILFSLQSRAQFKMPILGETIYPTPSSSTIFLDNTNTRYLSNYTTDFTTYATSFGVSIDVAAWSYGTAIGGGAMIAAGYHNLSPISSPFVGSGTTATIDLPHAVDVRVGYMEPFIVASYFDVSLGQYMFAWFDWAPPYGSSITQNILSPIPLPTHALAPITNYNRISMDINHDGNKVAIVYADGGYIYAAGLSLTGALFSHVITALPFTLSSLIGPSSGNINPDVSFNREFGPTGPTDYVFYTYYNIGFGDQAVFKINFNDILNKIPTSLITFLDANHLPSGVNYVNFDCPDQFSFNHWAYTYSDGNNIYLRADTTTTGASPFTCIVNDSTITGAPKSINTYSNTVPTLSYKNNLGRDEVALVWASNAVGAYVPSYSESYLGLTVAVNGHLAPKSVGGPIYAIIDNDPFAHYMSTNPLIAISRNSKNADRLVSFTTDNPTTGFELKHKNVSYTNDFYRQAQKPNTLDKGTTATLKLYPNPFSDILYLQIPQDLNGLEWSMSISDILGKTIQQYKGKTPNMFLQQISPNLKTGQYFLKLQYSNHTPQLIKITKQ